VSTACDNAVYAMLSDNAYFKALSLSVTNDGSVDGASRWLLNIGCQFLRDQSLPDGVWQSYDNFIYDFEALSKIWPAFEFAAEQCPIAADHIMPILARFLAERLPVVWDGDHIKPVAPVTKAVALADNIDTLVSLFAAEVTCNGSKDPFALRRAAKTVLQCIVFPVLATKVAA
jgi:hypothetical protein